MKSSTVPSFWAAYGSNGVVGVHELAVTRGPTINPGLSPDHRLLRAYGATITWLRNESLEDCDELPEPQDLASEAITELEAVVDDLREIVALVEKEEGMEK
jgi:hypothetical protein